MTRFFSAVTNASGRQVGLYLLALAAAITGVVAIVVGLSRQQSAPQPPASATGHISTSPTTGASSPHSYGGAGHSSGGASAKPPLPASRPVSIDIPTINVHSAVIPIGKAPDGSLAVPQPGPNLNKAAWYKNSVTPGQDGPAVIEGHIDTIQGPSVFFQLGAVRPGDHISITRQDHIVAEFVTTAVRSYPTHNAFPTQTVFGGQLAKPTLRLITCSNFDQSTGHYLGNTVVYADLTALHHVKPTN